MKSLIMRIYDRKSRNIYVTTFKKWLFINYLIIFEIIFFIGLLE